MPQIEEYRVTVGSLNIRKEPSAASQVLGQLRKDYVIGKLEETKDGLWVRVMVNGIEGWMSKKYLKKIPYIPPIGEDFAWMAVAEKEKGVQEVPGIGNNPRVLEYLNATRNLSAITKSRDETPWCSAFVNWCLTQAGYEGSGSALARSWMQWGHPITTPRRGCIVVFLRDKIYGHVGFYLEENATHIKALGGNQQNPENQMYEVCEKYYPKANLLGYRIP